MEREVMHNTTYRGSKQFSQHDVPHANANGFGAAADDYMERGIDLNEQLILNKPATFFFRMNSDAMINAGIFNSDVLIVDRSIKATGGKIIVAIVNGDLIVRRLQLGHNHASLVAENNRYGNIELEEFNDSTLWGVVTCVIHVYEKHLFVNKKSSQFNRTDKQGRQQKYY
jgi:DNA polymerase V